MKKTFVLSFILAVLAFSVTAFADNGSISLDCDVEGITYTLYDVDDYYVVDGEVYDNMFYAYKVDPNGSSADYTASAYILRDDVSSTVTGVTNSDGEVVFSDLDDGDYLLIAEVYNDGEYIYSVMPVVVSVYSEEVTTVSCKVSALSATSTDETQSVSALKVWSGDYTEEDLERSITVQLLRDGEIYDERELSSSNNWRCTWASLSTGYNWLVVEKVVPDGFMVNIDHDGSVFIITNSTLKGSPEGTTEGETEATTEKEVEATTEKSAEVTTRKNSGGGGGGRSGSERTTESEPETPGEGSTNKTTTENNDEPTEERGSEGSSSSSSQSGGESGSSESSSEAVTNENGEVLPPESSPGEPGLPPDESTPTPPDESQPPESSESLPQTGQLWYPVPILSCVGALFLIIGIGRRRMS
ncbi:MAG: Cna B-type domain-containing protein [Clostridiales bacterium]|nr:Cna B-type domain-containing protein [Clostridiales bacterium]